MDILEIMKSYGDNIAFSYGRDKVTYKQLLCYVGLNKNRMINEGINRGDRVLIFDADQADFIVSFFSVLALGCWVVPMPYDSTEYECEMVIERLNAKVLRRKCHSFKEYYLKEDVKIYGGDCSNDLFDNAVGNECGILHMTSGTTGESKFCIRTLEALMYEGISYRETFRLQECDRLMSLAPICHSFALGAVIMGAVVSGASICITSRFMPMVALRDLEFYRATFFVCVPFMIEMMIKSRSKHFYDLSEIRVALVGAGVITEELFNAFYNRFNIRLLSNYGSTETGALISRLDETRCDYVGIPQYGVDIRVLDDNMNEVLPNQCGEIWVKSKAMFDGYLGYAGNDLFHNGFFPMGDLVKYDEDGRIFILGRKKRLINMGGKKVNPQEVEMAIKKHCLVKNCVVFGIEKEKTTLIAVYTGQVISNAMLYEHCEKYLSRHKIPQRFIHVNKMPINKSGKIDLKQVVEEYKRKEVL